MIKSEFLYLTLLIYPLLVNIFNGLIRRKIANKTRRDQFKQDNEYLIRLVYLFLPLAVFHLEILYWVKGISFGTFHTSTFMFLIFLQVMVFTIALYRLYKFFTGLNNYTF